MKARALPGYAIPLGIVLFSLVLACPVSAEMKYNPYTDQWSHEYPDSHLGYNPHANQWEYVRPNEQLDYNPYNNQWDYSPDEPAPMDVPAQQVNPRNPDFNPFFDSRPFSPGF